MPTRHTIAEMFADLRRQGKVGLLPFIPAGYPDLETTAALLPALQRAGASVIEVGIPFSDPIADGPIIQEAFTEALKKKVRPADIFRTLAGVRGEVSVPLVAMVSYSIVFRYGVEHFLADAGEGGFDGLILPDLPPPEAEGICEKVRAAGLETILLAAPTSSPERRREIARLSSGFIYYLSVSGITGERDRLPADLEKNLAELRALTDRPICVGFGISRPEHVAQLRGHADGAIVGSAIVRRIKQAAVQGRAEVVQAVEGFCRQLIM